MLDTRQRSLIKGISWRFLGTIDTFILACLFFNSIKIAAPIAVTEVFSKVILYYLHERSWNLIAWGRLKNEPTHKRSVAKGVSWRLFGSFDTFLISLLYSGNGAAALKIGSAEVITKVGLFYLHERLWALIPWGRIFAEKQAAAPVKGQITSQVEMIVNGKRVYVKPLPKNAGFIKKNIFSRNNK